MAVMAAVTVMEPLGEAPSQTEAGTTTSPVPGIVAAGGVIPYFPPALFPDSLHPGGNGVSIEHTGSAPEARAETPLPLPPPTPSAVGAATARVNAQGGSLTEAEVVAVLRAAGAPEDWIPDMVAISWCESRHSPYAVGDSGNSLGMWQLWSGWFRAAGYSADQYAEPLVNARVALHVRETRGRFGGGGGWSCADLLGIP